MNRKSDRRVLAGLTMHSRITAIACSIGLLAPRLCAQDGDDDAQGFRAAREGVHFEIAADGEITVHPSPLSGVGGYSFADPDVVLHHCMHGADPPPWALWLFLGGEGLSDATDAVRWFSRLGILDGSPDDGMNLLQFVAERAPDDGLEPRAQALRRLLAVHALADLGFKPAIGRLEKLAADQGGDASLRRAARRAVASLRGDGTPPELDIATLSSLAEVLASSPADHDLVLVVDRTRMPAGRSLLAAVRAGTVAGLEAEIRQGSGRIGPADWAGVCSLSECAGLVAYELARRYGDQRIDRIVLAMRFGPTPNLATSTWLSLEGAFDLDAIRAAIPGAPVELRFALLDGLTIAIESERVVVTDLPSDAPRLGDEAARALVASLPDAPFRGICRRLPWSDAERFPETSFGLTLQPDDATAAALVVRPANERTIRRWLDENAPDAHVHPREHDLLITIPRGALDPGKLLLELSGRR